ncbi:hypothetical protein TBR22_A50760 [Luteitalea sp. TBR-22]|uniref:hypothetical protein n=1 Tax=Luteitalea sp. TBR-22 TaxID=2802971 RepID=UPI001AF99924|nr:hypothetical protein [Luteitalea sp. TBR-22]BCS35842.1 hypothetical protein TBR22_A50760 [Luteitalea sp. TBR-22]
MRRVLTALSLLLSLGVAPATAGDLTLRDVYELHRTGMGDDLLIAVVDAEAGPLELSFADIHDLKSAGFSERLIAALVRASRKPGTASSQPVVRQDVYAPTYAPIYAPTFVYAPTVVVTEERRREGEAPDQPSMRREKPPATWITRREDGKNVVPPKR